MDMQRRVSCLLMQKKTDLESSYAKKTDLESSYAKKTDLESSYAKKTDLESNYAKKSQLTPFITKTDLESSYAKKSQLTPFITRAELPTMSDYATKNELGDYATLEDLSDFATKSELSRHTQDMIELYPHFKISDTMPILNVDDCHAKCSSHPRFQDDQNHTQSRFISETNECYCFLNLYDDLHNDLANNQTFEDMLNERHDDVENMLNDRLNHQPAIFVPQVDFTENPDWRDNCTTTLDCGEDEVFVGQADAAPLCCPKDFLIGALNNDKLMLITEGVQHAISN